MKSGIFVVNAKRREIPVARIYFATNRNPNDVRKPTNFGKSFSEQGLTDLRFGMADIADGKITIKTETEEEHRLGSQTLFENLKSLMEEKKRDTLVFIHGFNNSFEEALNMAAKLHDNFASRGQEMQVVVFTWPSDGQGFPPKKYANDRHDAKASGFAFARGLMKLLDFFQSGKPCGQRMHLMAHSMGNYVLRHTVQELVKMTGGRPPRLFDTVFHMAADEDDDAYESKFKYIPLLDMTRAVYIYFNKYDKALIGSDLTKGNPDRLGSVGPRHPRTLPHKVSLVDVGAVEHDLILDKDFNHSYLAYNPIVADDLTAVLRGENPHKMANRVWDDRKYKFRLIKPE